MVLSEDTSEIISFSNASAEKFLQYGKGHPIFKRKLCLCNYSYKQLMMLQERSHLKEIHLLKYDAGFNAVSHRGQVTNRFNIYEIECSDLQQFQYLRNTLSANTLSNAKITFSGIHVCFQTPLKPPLFVRNLTIANPDYMLQILTSLRPTQILTIKTIVTYIDFSKLKAIFQKLDIQLSEFNIWYSKQTAKINHLEEFDRIKLAERQYIKGCYFDQGILQNSTGQIDKKNIARQVELIKKVVKIGKGMEFSNLGMFFKCQKEVMGLGVKKIRIEVPSEQMAEIQIDANNMENKSFTGEIELQPTSNYNYFQREQLTQIILQFLTSYPNMEGLKVIKDSFELKFPEISGNVVPKLKSFSIIGFKSADISFCHSILSSSCHTLQHLILNQTYSDYHYKLFHNLSNSKALQTLSIFADCTHPEDMQTIATFKNLRTLILSKSPHMYQAFFETHLLEALGNLEHLTVFEPLADPLKAFQGDHKCLKELKYDLYSTSKAAKLSKEQVEGIVKGKREGFVLESRFQDEQMVCEKVILIKTGVNKLQ
ncbi:hypothetical protein FGO68_gene15210 [Halteria grandinella]|uniref:Uncharacterized protein n=1 Tax=Halteria grandinella TaxID=5974 RepID=A0A8J8NGR1_HALGN|nr:hypothetical protein FGO68_gene15210 [Halteria grandinella]